MPHISYQVYRFFTFLIHHHAAHIFIKYHDASHFLSSITLSLTFLIKYHAASYFYQVSRCLTFLIKYRAASHFLSSITLPRTFCIKYISRCLTFSSSITMPHISHHSIYRSASYFSIQYNAASHFNQLSRCFTFLIIVPQFNISFESADTRLMPIPSFYWYHHLFLMQKWRYLYLLSQRKSVSIADLFRSIVPTRNILP